MTVMAALRQHAAQIHDAGTTAELYRLGLPRREKTHWDYLLGEMVSLWSNVGVNYIYVYEE
jgi:hypothetical protein